MPNTTNTLPVAGDNESDSRWKNRTAVGVAIASGMAFENISYRIGSRLILDDISLNVQPGEVLCLLGPSGSGKTSLLRIAAGLIEDSTGRVVVDGRVISGGGKFVPAEKRGIGLVFQDYALFPHMTLLENVQFGLTALGSRDSREQALRVLSRVGLGDRADQYPDVLSGGEQQRVALARALAPRPSILLMDEPFSGLDSRLRDSVREQSIELLRETRSTAIIVTHDAEEALRVGDHIALMRDGKIVQYGTGRDLYYNPTDLFAAGFFSEINVLPAAISGGTAKSVLGEIPTALEDDPDAKVAIRLSDVIVKSYEENSPWLPGRVVARRFLGTSELLDISLQGLEKPMQARIRAGAIGRDDKLVRISVNPELMMIFPS